MRWLAWGAGAAAVPLLALELAIRFVPFPEEAFARHSPGVVVTDRHGNPLRVRLNPEGQDCRPVYRADASHWVVKALVAAEDQRFFEHGGLDFIAIGRAVLQNVAGLRRVSGASTLSTQAVRLAQPRPRTWGTKLVEAFRAAQLERRHDKWFILDQWLNRAPFGGNIVGIEAASRRYFGKAAADLDIAEAALLAGVPQSPARLRPDRHFDRAKRRQAYVLDRMLALGFIDADQHRAASREPLDVRPAVYPFGAPHFCTWLLAAARPASDGTLRSTIDPDLQELAERALRAGLDSAAIPGASGAVVLIENDTGAIRAFVGSPDYFSPSAGQVDGALALRSPGSTLKPFAFAAAFDAGFLLPESPLDNAPLVFRDLAPQNFDGLFGPRVTAHEALVQSLNIPAVQVERRLGVSRLLRLLRRLGLSSLRHSAAHYGIGLVLGNPEVRLLDLANAYACLARGGAFLPAAPTENQVAANASRDAPQLFSPQSAWLLSSCLSGEERSLDFAGHLAEAQLPVVAWKTGTSAGFRDAWTVAWNPQWTLGVWVGRPDGAPDPGLVGRSAAAPIAGLVFRALYPDGDAPAFERPGGLVEITLCLDSGQPATPRCSRTAPALLVDGVSNRRPCPLAHENTTGSGQSCQFFPVCVPGNAPRIVQPVDGSTFAIFPDAPALDQRIPLEAAPGAELPLYWFVDGRLFTVQTTPAPVLWPLVPGTHRIVCSSPLATSAGITIAVQ